MRSYIGLYVAISDLNTKLRTYFSVINSKRMEADPMIFDDQMQMIENKTMEYLHPIFYETFK